MLIKDVDQLDQVISGSDIISTTSEQIVQLTKLQMYFILNGKYSKKKFKLLTLFHFRIDYNIDGSRIFLQ